jgi:hypothetical protein
MRKKSKQKLTRLDLFVILLCAAGAFLFLCAFYRDFTETFSRLNESPIGTITFKRRTAQRRFADRLFWNYLQRESPVYDGDLIRTADLSEAIVTLAGGAAIDMGENSLIQIFASPDENAAVRIEGSGELILTTGGRGIILASGENTVSVEPESVASVTITAADSVFPGDSVSPDKAASSDVSPNDLSGGEAGFFLRVHEGKAVLAGEQKQAEAGEILLAGKALSGESALSGKAPSEEPRAALLSPGLNAYVLRKGTEPVRFSWNRINYESADLTRLEISEGRNFSRIIYGGDHSGSGAAVEIPAGLWWWRVYPLRDGKGLAENAETGKFTVVAAVPPALISPREGEALPYRTAVSFRWAEQEGASAYLLEAADNPDMNNPALSIRAGIPQAVSELAPGRWYWRLTPLYAGDFAGTAASSFFAIEGAGAGRAEASGSTPPRPFTASADAPLQRTIFPPDNYSAADSLLPDLRFTWKTNLPGPTRFQLSRSPDFSRLVLDEAVFGETFQGRPLPSGEYYWRISNGETHSPGKRLAVVPSLPAPVVLTGGALALRPGTQALFTWRPVEGASYYRFRLYGEEAGRPAERPVYESASLRENSLALSMDSLKEGPYTLTVQAFAAESPMNTRRTGFLGKSRIVMRYIKPLSLDHPPLDRTYSGLDASRRPDTLRWSSEDLPAKSRFVLSRGSAAGPVVLEQANPPRSIPLPRLPAGDYYWIVTAETPEGFDISPTAPGHFRVLPIPPLPAPENRRPPEGFVLGPEELRNSRTLTFSWDRLPGANGYVFTLYSAVNNQRRRVIEIDTGAAAEYTLEDLRLLSAGEFVWQVRGVNRMEGGLFEQPGAVGESRFTVYLPEIRREQPPQTGILYGR